MAALITRLNFTFLFVLGLSFVIVHVNVQSVDALVRTDDRSIARIAALERRVRHAGPAETLDQRIELARLYSQAGEFPWAWGLIHDLEVASAKSPEMAAELGAAYLQIGCDTDALRVFSEFDFLCASQPCPSSLAVKVSIFRRAALLLRDRGINSRLHPEAANRILWELLKPTALDKS